MVELASLTHAAMETVGIFCLEPFIGTVFSVVRRFALEGTGKGLSSARGACCVRSLGVVLSMTEGTL